MPLRSALAPGFIRITYSGTVIPHHMTVPIKFVTADPAQGSEPAFFTTDDSEVVAGAAIDDLVTALLPSYAPETSFGLAEVYKVDAETGIASFVWATDIGEDGTSADPQIPFVQGEFIFRTANGGVVKVFTMEGVYEANARNVGSVPAGPRQTLLDYVLGGTNIIYGRRNAFPLGFISFTSKVNDNLRRRGAFVDV